MVYLWLRKLKSISVKFNFLEVQCQLELLFLTFSKASKKLLFKESKLFISGYFCYRFW
jgi:hypothetical protein